MLTVSPIHLRSSQSVSGRSNLMLPSYLFLGLIVVVFKEVFPPKFCLSSSFPQPLILLVLTILSDLYNLLGMPIDMQFYIDVHRDIVSRHYAVKQPSKIMILHTLQYTVCLFFPSSQVNLNCSKILSSTFACFYIF
jgi:hypothetical protein